MKRALWLVLLPVILAGCVGGGTHSGSARPTRTSTGRLAITVRLFVPGVRLDHHARYSTRHYTLLCGPVGGTMPNPQGACAALHDYLVRGAPQPSCGGPFPPRFPPATARLAGTFNHQPVLLRIDVQSWCGQSIRVMRDLWRLSTFPCSTGVTHTQYIVPYSKFAAVTGCERASTTPVSQPIPDPTFRVLLPRPHQRWKNLFAVEVMTLHRLPHPLKMWLYDVAHHVVAHHWMGDCRTCATVAGGTLGLNIRYHVDREQPGSVMILDPTSGYRVTVPVVLTNLPAPSE